MALVSDRCICLRKFEYSETSQILTLFARERGLVRVIAKGAHRKTKAGASKFGGGVDLLDTGEAVFTDTPERDLATLTEWQLLDGRLELRKSLRSVYAGVYCAELLTTLFEEHDPHPELFDRLDHTLSDLATPKVEETLLAFELDVLREAGYLPELEACVACGAVAGNDRIYFSPARGGIVCRNCESVAPDRGEIDVRLLRIIQTILRLPRAGGAPQRLPRLTRHQTDPINRILIVHIEQTLSKHLRTSAYVAPRRANSAGAPSQTARV
jgi:DNA repair protein RecO (recombination protein O)